MWLYRCRAQGTGLNTICMSDAYVCLHQVFNMIHAIIAHTLAGLYICTGVEEEIILLSPSLFSFLTKLALANPSSGRLKSVSRLKSLSTTYCPLQATPHATLFACRHVPLPFSMAVGSFIRVSRLRKIPEIQLI